MSKENILIELSSSDLNPSRAQEFVAAPEVGGIVVFVGTVRNHSKGKDVIRLEFESYEAMAVKEMSLIAQRALDRWPLHKVAILHRTGVLPIGEIPVVIAVSSAHRKEAFEACEFCIDELKKSVPIWKKEFFEGGEHWVSPTP